MKTQADIIIIYAGNGPTAGLYVIKNEHLKGGIERWGEEHRTVKSIVSRDGAREWWARGIIVPIHEFSKYCFRFIPLSELGG